MCLAHLKNFCVGGVNSRCVRVILFIVFSVFTQTMAATPIDSCRVRVLYKYYIATQDREHQAMTDSVLSILEIGDSIAKYGDQTRYVRNYKDNPEAIKGVEVDRFATGINAYTFVFRQYLNDEAMRVREFLHPCYFVYQEPVPDGWIMESDTATVMGYLCQKARLAYGGREWVVWYAPELPVSSGPWKLCGLPGLILKAEDRTGTHRFEAYSLLKSANQTIEDEAAPEDRKEVRDKFIAHRNKIKLDERYMKKPYFHDDPAAKFLLRPRSFYEEHGAQWEINGVSYPTRLNTDKSKGLMTFVFNYFQPLELQ